MSEVPLSKNEQKRVDKQKKKDEEKSKKEAERAAKEQANPATVKVTKKKPEEEEIEPDKYYEGRCKVVQQIKTQEAGTDFFPYPHKWVLSHTLPKLRAEYDGRCTENGVFLEETVSVAGRIHSIRTMGANLVFYDVRGEDTQFQVMGNQKLYGDGDEFEKVVHMLKRGDIIGVVGKPGRTKAGEFSVQPSKLRLLSPCLHILPKQYGLKDQETRYRQRYLDLMINANVRKTFEIRAKVLKFIRNFLDSYGFLEVETPVLNMVAGGATAKPFITTYNALNMDVFMRIAPELYLKMLIVGGLDKVYEMGKLFRNEGMDQTHNPEFTSVEFYWAYADYYDLMDFTELMLSTMVKEITGSDEIKVTNEEGVESVISFARPWKRIPIIEGLEEVLNEKFPADLASDEANQFLQKLCIKHKCECSAPRTTARIIDKLAGQFLEEGCMNPTFLIDHPQIMCPLAKYHRSKPGQAERFELFINQKEHVNSYTELNDPFVQRKLFEDQAGNKASGDEEACGIDEDFVKSMEHGLPPTAGWGLGVDRMCMLLTNNPNNIQEVILFPAMKPKNHDENMAGHQKEAVSSVVVGQKAPVQVASGLGPSRTFALDQLKDVESYLAECQFLSGKELPGDQDYDMLKAMNEKGFTPHSDKLPNTFGWFWHMNQFSAPARDLWKSANAPAKTATKAEPKAEPKVEAKKAAPAPAKADDDDFDLFGDETAEDKVAAEALKSKVEAPKKVKVAPIAKSLVCFDVKGYEVGQDFEAMAARIRAEVNADGLIWMDTHKVVPIAFGMMKLQMTMLIVDDKIQTDDIFEQIEAWEDDVQSTDVVSFNKA